jgi:hypothetical protein
MAGMEMKDNNHKSRTRTKDQLRQPEWPEKMKLSQAHKFLGISSAKMTTLISNGTIKYEQHPLDNRVKLVRRADLEALKRQITHV